MQLPIIYSRTSTGAIQQWQIIVSGNSFYTIEGQKDGKLTTSKPTICEPKNVGKANETSPEEQACAEAKAKWQKKIDSGYYEDINQIDIQKFVDPMLAKTYDDEFNPSLLPVWSQRKLDGQRCVCKNDGMWSRNGKKIISAPHIRKALQPIFDKNPNAIFDGELYCHKLSNDFNKIISLVKKVKPTTSELQESADVIQYWIYDYISEGKLPYSQRYEKLTKELTGLHKSLVVVEATKVETQEQLDALNGQYIQEGYEGQMIRLDKQYEHKRSKNLLKRKEFDDTEFKIIDIFEGEGNRSGMAGYAVIELEDKRTCKSNIKGNQEWLKELLENSSEVKGKLATVRHFKRTPDGVPRFPYVIAIRDYE
jgi:DNA ligase-1